MTDDIPTATVRLATALIERDLRRARAMPSVSELRAALQAHPEVLWALLQDIARDPPKIAGPWQRHLLDMMDGYTRPAYTRYRTDHQTAARVEAIGQAGGKWIRWQAIVWQPNTMRELITARMMTVLDNFDDRETAQAAADLWLREREWTLL